MPIQVKKFKCLRCGMDYDLEESARICEEDHIKPEFHRARYKFLTKDSCYPEILNIPFKDGSVITYTIRAPMFDRT